MAKCERHVCYSIPVPLLKRWRQTLPSVDHNWVSATLFYSDHHNTPRFDFSKVGGLWVHPPHPPLTAQGAPKLEHFFGHRVFIWMPVRLWSLKVACPHSDCSCLMLSYAGVYRRVRQVCISFIHRLARKKFFFFLQRTQKVFDACVRSALLHGSETWAPTAPDLQRLRRSRNDKSMIRWICGVKPHDEISIDLLYARLGIQ